MWKKPWIVGTLACAIVGIAAGALRLRLALVREATETKAEIGLPAMPGPPRGLQARAMLAPRALPWPSEARREVEAENGAEAASSAANPTERLRALTLEQRVGQLFVFGFMGENAEPGLSSAIAAGKPGAVIFFGRNVRSAEQVAKLTYAAQLASFKATGLPLLIAVDQEGGNVIRIRTAPPLPSALALGGTRDPRLAFDAGKRTGRLLKALGFNMNLAPVMDVTDSTRDKFIGTRSFGDDPRLVARMSGAFAAGLESESVLPTGKHFPGHGGMNVDSHLRTPVKRTPLAELLRKDVVPFAEAARWSAPPAMMVAHVAYPSLDASGTPATFSRPIVTDLLRRKMGFEGLVMTDDIEMAGASAIRDVGERAVRAIEAGVDLVMIGWNRTLQRELPLAVLRAVKSGRIKESRIDESVKRVLTAKARYSSFQPPTAPSNADIASALGDRTLRQIADRAAGATFERAAGALDTRFLAERADAPVFVFSASQQFFRSFKAKSAGRTVRFYRLDSEGRVQIDRIMRSNPSAIGVFYVSGSLSASLANGVSEDVASRIFLVNSEARSALASPNSFRLLVELSFRHGSAGGRTADLLFAARSSAPSQTHVAEPTAGRQLGEKTPRRPASGSQVDSNSNGSAR